MRADKVVQYVPARNGVLQFAASWKLLLPSEQPEKLGHKPETFLYTIYIY